MDSAPFGDLTVLDMSQAIAGPTAGALLADFGADVVSVEPPGGASERRFAKGTTLPNIARNKRSIVLNLKTEKGRDALYRLVEKADVLLHNNRPGKMGELGCDYETLSKINPAIVFCSITGYGEEGRYSGRPGFDPLAQAMSGLMWLTGEPDRKPSRVGASTIDICTGVLAAYAIWPAVERAERTGEGEKVETSLFDTAATFMGQWYTYCDETGADPKRQGHTWNAYAPAGIIETADGGVYLAAPTDRHWRSLCEAIGREDLVNDPRFTSGEDRVDNRDELFAELDETCASMDRSTVIERLSDAGVPAGELFSVAEAAENEHLRERGTIREMEDVDGSEVLGTTSPLHLSETPPRIEDRPPRIGEHTREVLAECGYDGTTIDRLVDEGVVAED